ERDVLRRKLRRRRNHDRITYALRKGNGPAQRLHAAQTAADHCRPAFYPQPVGKARLCTHPIDDSDHWKTGTPGFTGRWIDSAGTGRTVATTQIVDPDDEEAIGIERLARPDD